MLEIVFLLFNSVHLQNRVCFPVQVSIWLDNILICYYCISI